MRSLVSTGFACAGFATLLWAGLMHVAHRRRFATVLVSHQVWPRRFAVLIAASAIALELAIGSLGLVSLISSPDLSGIRTIALWSAASLCAAYTLYAWFLWRRRPALPCGCSAGDLATNGWVVARAGFLSLGAWVGFALRESAVGIAPLNFEAFVAFTFGLALMTVSWLLPEVLASSSDVSRGTQEVEA